MAMGLMEGLYRTCGKTSLFSTCIDAGYDADMWNFNRIVFASCFVVCMYVQCENKVSNRR
jgi:hypothetical protein